MLLRHSCLFLVRYLLLILTAALHIAAPFASGTEDVVIPVEDEEKRQETVYVTGSRPDGSVGSLVTFIQSGGTINDFMGLGLRGDGLSFAIACSKNPDSFACDHLKCEVNPNDPSCESVQETIVVTAERPETKTYRWLFNFIRTSFGTLYLDLGLVPPDSEKARDLTEKEVCEFLARAKEGLLQEAYENLDWIADQYYFYYGLPDPFTWRFGFNHNFLSPTKVEFDPNKLAKVILEHGKKVLIKGYAQDGTVLAKTDYWQEVGFYVYWNKRTGLFRVGKYTYGPISESTERMYPAYDPVTGNAVDRAGTVRIDWKSDNLKHDEELVARVHLHPKTYYRRALYPSAGDIAGIDEIRRYALIHNRKWNHVHDFILLPPTKDFDRAKFQNGKQNNEITMLIHDSKWTSAKAEDMWSKLIESLDEDKSVYYELDKHIYRMNESGKVVEGPPDSESYDLDNRIEEFCE